MVLKVGADMECEHRPAGWKPTCVPDVGEISPQLLAPGHSRLAVACAPFTGGPSDGTISVEVSFPGEKPEALVVIDQLAVLVFFEPGKTVVTDDLSAVIVDGHEREALIEDGHEVGHRRLGRVEAPERQHEIADLGFAQRLDGPLPHVFGE